MYRLFLPLLMAMLCAGFHGNVMAQANQDYHHQIAAVVGEEMVSHLDLEERIKMVMATTGMTDSLQARQQLAPQIMRGLIDESLQRQEFKRYNIQVSDDEIHQTIANIETQRGKEVGSLLAYLVRRGAHPQSFKDQLRAQIGWSKFVSARLASQVTVSDEELRHEIDYLRREGSKQEQVLISGISLPVGSPEEAGRMQALAMHIMSELDKGASFEGLASQISDAGARATSRLWMNVRELDPLVSNALVNIEKSGVTPPLTVPGGIQIIKFYDRRTVARPQDAELLFKQLILSLDHDAHMQEVDVLMNIARAVAKDPGKCMEKNIAGIDNFDGLNIDASHTRTRLSSLSPEVLPLVKDLGIEEVSEPFAAPDGIHLLMLCEKTSQPFPVPDKEKVRQRLVSKKLELQALKRLRELRRDTFIDVRI